VARLLDWADYGQIGTTIELHLALSANVVIPDIAHQCQRSESGQGMDSLDALAALTRTRIANAHQRPRQPFLRAKA
jgi:hypothetical protein